MNHPTREPGERSIRILLVDEIPLTCDLFTAVLDDEPDLHVIGCASTFAEALALAPEADAILVNTRMAGHAALDVIGALNEMGVPAEVLALGLGESKSQILPYIQAGATGYVLKDDSVDEMVARIRAAHNGEPQVAPKIAAAMMSRLAELAGAAGHDLEGNNGHFNLTPRELQTLELVGQGLTNRQIAERLVIATGTVKNHVHSVLTKLDVSSRHDAAALLPLIRNKTHAFPERPA